MHIRVCVEVYMVGKIGMIKREREREREGGGVC